MQNIVTERERERENWKICGAKSLKLNESRLKVYFFGLSHNYNLGKVASRQPHAKKENELLD
jgi:hypothetical protein